MSRAVPSPYGAALCGGMLGCNKIKNDRILLTRRLARAAFGHPWYWRSLVSTIAVCVCMFRLRCVSRHISFFEFPGSLFRIEASKVWNISRCAFS